MAAVWVVPSTGRRWATLMAAPTQSRTCRGSQAQAQAESSGGWMLTE